MEVILKNSSKFLGAFLILFLVFVQGGGIAYSSPQYLAELKEISYQKVDAQLEVTIKIEGEFKFEVFGLVAPSRLVLDIWTIQKISAEPLTDVNYAGVLRIRSGEFKPEVARIVFDLGEKIPSYKTIQVEGGLKLVFWLEEGGEREEKLTPQIKETAKEPEKAKKEIPEVTTKRKFFIQGIFGAGLFLKPDIQAQKDLSIYGETGYLKETYKLKSNLMFDLSLGSYFKIGEKTIKGGAGVSYCSIKHKGNLEFSLPHPFIPNSPRTLTLEDNLKDTIFNIYAYGLLSVLGKARAQIWAGPVIGFSIGKFTTLEDIDIKEKSPFASTDISITSKSYVKDSITSFLFGGLLSFEYSLSHNFILALDWKFIFFNPKVTNLGKRANFLQNQIFLGIQYNL